MKQTTKSLFYLVFAIYPLFALHSALMQGYFVDGMIYASLARNLAEGYGSFWHMSFSEELFNSFREHPPLGIYIQSLFYSLFGDTELIDKYYGFVIGFGILGLIAMLRNRLYADCGHGWFAILVFLLFPLTTYVLSYNWLEHILTLNILLSVLAVMVALTSNAQWVNVVGSLLAGTLVFTGVMIKGPTALYPLAVPFIAWVTLRDVDTRRALTALALMSLALAASIWFFILQSAEASAFFGEYLQHQVAGSLRGENSVHVRTKLLESLLTEELIAPLVIFSLMMWWNKVGWHRLRPDSRFWFFLLVALSGSVPMMLSPKQNDYYLFISLPFYALSIAALFEPLRESLESKVSSGQRLVKTALLLLLLALVVMLVRQGEYRKDKAYHQSFTEPGITLPRRVRVSACPLELFMVDWNIAVNFQRYYAATLTRLPDQEYLVTTSKDATHCIDETKYTLASESETPYVLYRRKDMGAGNE